MCLNIKFIQPRINNVKNPTNKLVKKNFLIGRTQTVIL